MFRALSLIVLFCFSIVVYGQNDSLKIEILKYDNSKAFIISKARSMIIDNFIKENFKKVREIKDYLMKEVTDRDYAAFYPGEYWLILYWTQEFRELADNIDGFDSSVITSFRRKVKPQNDMLYSKLVASSRESRSYLIGSITGSGLNDADKDFLILFLNYQLSGSDNEFISQDLLNEQSDGFLRKHPGSRYEDLVRKNIRFRYVPSKWGLGFEFFSGYGIITDKLPESFRNNVPIGVAFDLYYNRAVLYLRDYIGFSRTVRDIPFSEGYWPERSQARVYLPEVSLGYILLEKRKVNVAPFAGMSWIDFSPTEYDIDKHPELDDAGLNFTASWTMGVNMDFKLGKPVSLFGAGKAESSFWFVRVRYSYNLTRLGNKYDGFNGNMHCITIGIGGLGRRMKREL